MTPEAERLIDDAQNAVRLHHVEYLAALDSYKVAETLATTVQNVLGGRVQVLEAVGTIFAAGFGLGCHVADLARTQTVVIGEN